MAKSKATDAVVKTKVGQKIIDVSAPNESAPSANSKSVIIKHQPLIRDPMMAPAGETAATVVPDATTEPAVVHRERVILPQPSEPAAPVVVAEAKPAEPAEPTIVETSPTESFSVDDSIPEVQSPGYTSQISPKAAEAAAETKVDERRKVLDDLVRKQTYFLPINSAGNHKKKRFVALGVLLIIVLGAAWFDIALDAGLIQIAGLEAPTNFFSN